LRAQQCKLMVSLESEFRTIYCDQLDWTPCILVSKYMSKHSKYRSKTNGIIVVFTLLALLSSFVDVHHNIYKVMLSSHTDERSLFLCEWYLFHLLISVFRIIAERVPSSHRLKRQSFLSPCDMSHSQLHDYQTAIKLGDLCYIAAELVIFREEKLFVVGDNKTYGGFYNAPLMRDETYHIWFGLVITVDGVSTCKDMVLTVKYY